MLPTYYESGVPAMSVGWLFLLALSGRTHAVGTPSGKANAHNSSSLFGDKQQTKGFYNASLIRNITRLLDTLLDNYDRKLRPGHFTEKPLVVTVDLSVRSIGPISEKDMEFAVDAYFRQEWLDERLAFDAAGDLYRLSLSAKMLSDIWRPDTYVRNGRQSYLHKLTIPNILLRVYNNGKVYVSQRLTIRARCPMYLRKFPMDTQACPLYFGSLGYGQNDVQFKWKGEISAEKELNELAQYSLVDIYEASALLPDLKGGTTDEVSVLQAYFILEREHGYYFLQIYAPCSFIVIMSWVSFWINKEASPARVQLGIMTVLNMCTLGLGHRNDLPKVSYSTALDIYIVVCFGFVFAALVEYAVINFAHLVYMQRTMRLYQSINPLGIATALVQQPVTQMTAQMERIRGMKQAVAVERMRIFAGNIMGGVKQLKEARGDQTFSSSTNAMCSGREDDNAHLVPPQRTWRQRILPKAREKRKTGLAGVAQKAERKRRELLANPDPGLSVDRIDNISKVAFPLSYVVFNVLYWSAFLHWIPDEIESWDALKAAGYMNDTYQLLMAQAKQGAS